MAGSYELTCHLDVYLKLDFRRTLLSVSKENISLVGNAVNAHRIHLMEFDLKFSRGFS